MSDSPVPDLSTVASPQPQSLSYQELRLSTEPFYEGGQAMVYEAEVSTDSTPDRVAVKQPDASGKTVYQHTIEALLSEAETWEMLSRREREKPRWKGYDHIVGIVDSGERPAPWIAMEYMDGGSLEGRIAEEDNGLPIDEALWIGECLSRGLEVAHNEVTAHLDLKPANILFRKTQGEQWDVPKIADWGIARDLATEESTGEQFSPVYAAPEQFALDYGGSPDTATDIYQLGGVLYAMFTGRPPHGSGYTKIKARHSQKDLPEPPSTHRGEIPEAVDDCLLRALQPRKADRYRSVSKFEQKLRGIRENLLAGDFVASEQEWPIFQGDTASTGFRPQASAPALPVTEIWHFETGHTVHSSPAVADGTVFVGSNDGNLYAVDASTGEEVWQFETGRWVSSSPSVIEGTVFVGSGDNTLYAVDTSTGEEVWQFETGSGIQSSPAVADGFVFVRSDDGNLYAVDASTGEEVWQFEIRRWGLSSPAVADGTVFVGSNTHSDGIYDSYLYAVDANTGEKVWHFETGTWVRSSPSVTNGTVFVGSDDGNLYAVDASAGKEVWHFETGAEIRTSPSVADGFVFVGSDNGNLYAVDANTGEEVWHLETGGWVRSSPAVADGTVFVGSYDNTLYAVDANTGEEVWQFNTGSEIHSTPAVADGTVFVGSYDNNLYAISEE